VILADEPTAALDGHTGRSVMQTMHDLAHKHNRAVVVVTHDSRVLEFGDRIVHMEDGRILEAPPAREILRIPPHSVVPASIATAHEA
jgi:putative ABC transport system ATP-binding protein